jgi:hypothetical protein
MKSFKKKTKQSLRTLYASVIKYSMDEIRCAGGKSDAARKRIARAKKLLQASILIFGQVIADKIKVCDTEFCKKTSLTGTIRSMRSKLKTLYQLSRQAQYGAGAACGSPHRSGDTATGPAQAAFNKGTGAIRKVPPITCVN